MFVCHLLFYEESFHFLSVFILTVQCDKAKVIKYHNVCSKS